MKDKLRDYRKVVAPYYFEKGFNPFSYSFDYNKVILYTKNLNTSQNKDLILTLESFKIFNEIHHTLINQIDAVLSKINQGKEELIETIVALCNEQNLTVTGKIQENLPENNATSFHFSNTTIASSENSTNPIPLQGLMEANIDFLSLIAAHINTKPKTNINEQNSYTENEKIEFYEQLFKLTNEYYNIKQHFETCLNLAGNIIISDRNIQFECKDYNLGLATAISSSIIKNRNIFNYFTFNEKIRSDIRNVTYSGNKINLKILKDIKRKKGEFVFSIRKKKKSEYHHLFTDKLTIDDYYPHLKDFKLEKLDGLTIKDLIHLHENLSIFISRIQNSIDFKKVKQELNSIRQWYSPRIKKDTFINYFKKTSTYSDAQIMKYLSLLENNGRQNFYARPFIAIEDAYIFPFLPITGYNPYFLIDHWLESIDYSLDERGYEFQNIVKKKITECPIKEHNKFKVIQVNDIEAKTKGLKQEIDLIIELKDCLILGEIKSVKFPMSERDSFVGLADRVDKAVGQLFIKERFLVNNRDEILDRYGFDSHKKIVKVIVINYPIFIGCKVKGISVIDYNSLVPYFKTSKSSLKSFNNVSMEKISEQIYYSCEKSFNENFESYISNPTDYDFLKRNVSLMNLNYYLPNIDYKVFFNDYRDVNFAEMQELS